MKLLLIATTKLSRITIPECIPVTRGVGALIMPESVNIASKRPRCDMLSCID